MKKPKTFDEVLELMSGKPILVANRGIPGRRICRSISEMSQAISIMTATDVDKTSPATSGANELLLLGEDPRGYLDLDRIVKLAKRRGVIAIHPGWGFAAEDDSFPEKCERAGIIFIGPPAEPMRTLGNKVAVRKLAQELGIPVIAGSQEAVDIPQARLLANEIGLPIMLKAEGGGGGRGIYEVHDDSQLENAFHKASAQAQAAFGNPRLFVEKLLTSVRHIEIQVIADQYDNVFTFDERDCTVQRSHQKLIEITPSPWAGMTEELRTKLKDYSRRLVTAVGYHSLCTVEFLIDPEGNPYLIEVNTRLQVEHGITECRYGIDLVEEQIAIAFGAKLRFNEENTKPFLHALQVRINFEDPQRDFAPNAGHINRYLSPGGSGVRLDSCICEGYDFPAQYDSAAALLITYGRSWQKTVWLMRRALCEYVIGGVRTTIPFHRQVLKQPEFIDANYDTKFVDRHKDELLQYWDEGRDSFKLCRLMADISAKGYNEYIQLGEYRGRNDKRLGRFNFVKPSALTANFESRFHRGMERLEILDRLRIDREQGIVHLTDTTTRDITQSNSGNRFRLAEDRLIGPYLDQCGFFSLENGGGAHFHVAMLANMTYPFSEAKEWNQFAPETLKQILIRSTNVLGYKPQPPNLMRLTGEMICEHFDVIRCFDFLNHIENMRPFAEVALHYQRNIFEPAISMSWAEGFDIEYYMQVTQEIIKLCADVTGLSHHKTQQIIILGLKDMAGVCPPRFMRQLVAKLRKTYPDLVLHYHRHYTDGLFVPACAAAAEAGAHIIDVAIGSAVRWYGQGDVLATAAYLEGELGLKTHINREAIRAANFALKQIMPYYDRYVSPYFQGIDHDVVEHGMPGGATSSSQEGALKQGYIHLLPYMLKYLAYTRKIVRYHDVTPGSQITWNCAFLNVVDAFKRGGDKEVRRLLSLMETVTTTPDEELTSQQRKASLDIYRNANDAFRDLLKGKFGRLPLGWPADWVYKSAFGGEWRRAKASRSQESPLAKLKDLDFEAERNVLRQLLEREPSDEEFVLYLNHPADALKTFDQCKKYSNANNIPLDVWFEGAEKGVEIEFMDDYGKPHRFEIIDIPPPNENGISDVRYIYDSERLSHQVKLTEAKTRSRTSVMKADPNNPSQIAAPSTGQLWMTYVKVGDVVKKGEEIFNISVMKQENAVFSPADGMITRVLKSANFPQDKKMFPVVEGELIIEIGPIPTACEQCREPIILENSNFCPNCGAKR